MNAEKRNLLQLRILMCLGVFPTFGRPCRKAKLRTESSMADFHISYCCELLFCQQAQQMVLERRAEVLTYLLFPGAFVTALVPAYTLFLFLIGSNV
jgi:hypothetical protein